MLSCRRLFPNTFVFSASSNRIDNMTSLRGKKVKETLSIRLVLPSDCRTENKLFSWHCSGVWRQITKSVLTITQVCSTVMAAFCLIISVATWTDSWSMGSDNLSEGFVHLNFFVVSVITAILLLYFSPKIPCSVVFVLSKV